MREVGSLGDNEISINPCYVLVSTKEIGDGCLVSAMHCKKEKWRDMFFIVFEQHWQGHHVWFSFFWLEGGRSVVVG